MNDESPSLVIYGDPVRGRSCGSCTLCCTLLPTDLPRGKKLANEKCENICSKGCKIYETRPLPCRAFSCRWLFDEHTDKLRRPDKTGYVIDPMLDGIVANGQAVDVFQVWVDPHRRNAHRDPALREYLSKMAEIFRLPAIIRWSSEEAMMLIAPCLNPTKDWMEITRDKMTQKTEDEMKLIYHQAQMGELQHDEKKKLSGT